MTTKLDLTVKNISITETGLCPGWINGEIGKFVFSSKVYDLPSKFGIKNGRVSKLSISDREKREAGHNYLDSCIVNYDRGWDIRPKSTEDKKVLKAVLAFLEALPTSSEEAVE